MRRTGIFLEAPGEGACPVIYLEGPYERLCRGQEFAEVSGEVWGIYLSHAGKEPLDREEFMDWGRAKKKVSVRLVHYGKNREMLKTVPHRRFLDLAEVYYFTTGMDGGEGSAALITDGQMGCWGICRRDLEGAAYENHKRNGGTSIQSMDEVIGELLGTGIGGGCGPMQMYVATNRWKLGGASSMLFADEFRWLAQELGSDLYILPSSIHEVLLLPESAGSPEELAGIVREVNRTQVLPEERLSDNVYLYERKSGSVKIA